MLKKIPGSKNYRIDRDGIIYDHSNEKVSIPIIDGSVEIELFGVIRTVKLEWLKLFSWYEYGYIQDIENKLDLIDFVDANCSYLRLRCGKLAIHKEPIYFKDNYRYIPNYPQYAISQKGKLIDTWTNEYVTNIRTCSKGYVSCYIRTPDSCGNRNIKLHRLLAYTWLPNSDFINRFVINHIDGNPNNNELDNLEWCTLSENVQHALNTGLTQTNISVKVRDVYTGEIEIYKSISDLVRTLNIGTGTSVESICNKLPGHLWKKRYEVKPFDDASPWYYEKFNIADFDPKRAYYTFTVKNLNTGEERGFNSLKKISKVYDIPYKSISVNRYIDRFKQKYPFLEIIAKKNNVSGPYYVYNKETMNFYTCTSIIQIAEVTGRTRAEIQLDLTKQRKYVYDNKWLIVVGDTSSIDFNQYVDKKPLAKSIEIKNIITNEIVIYPSMKNAARETGINWKTISKMVKTGNSFKGLVFREII